MTRTIEAVYEKGIFKPLQPILLNEGQRVQVHISSEPGRGSNLPEEVEAIMRLGQQVYEGLTEEEIAEIEKSFQRHAP